MVQKFKYPRTFNLPWSESDSSDDVWWKDCSNFEGKKVVVTEKIDGECTTVYPDGSTHARSVDSKHHPSRSWMKQYAATFAFNIPQGWRITGENVFAMHSIFYTELPSYFLVFGIYDERNECLPWFEVENFCDRFGLHTVPVLHRGIWDERLVRDGWNSIGRYPTFQAEKSNPVWPEDFSACSAEGYVVRIFEGFPYGEFSQHCAKYVRKDHVRTSQHWMEQSLVQNLLRVS